MPVNIDLTPNQVYPQAIHASLKLNEDGNLSGTWEETKTGYAALDLRDEIEANKSKGDYIKEVQKKHPGLTINTYKFENLDSLNKDVKIDYDITLKGYLESKENLLIIHPLLLEQMQGNPFHASDRKCPIDFCYKSSKSYSAQFEIPHGYKVTDFPKPPIYQFA